MFITTSKLGRFAVATGLLSLLTTVNAYAGPPSSLGVVRISSFDQAEQTPPTPEPASIPDEPSYVPAAPGMNGYGCGDSACGPFACEYQGCFDGCRMKKLSKYMLMRDIQLRCLVIGEWWNDQADQYYARNHRNSKTFAAYLRCKYGYFLPTGCCGAGCPPIGAYGTVYAVNPQYFDERDGKLYSAQGYGTPVAVPLAPTVRYTYNYGWGYPSSRLTPISNVNPIANP